MSSIRHITVPEPPLTEADDRYLDAAREAILAVGWSRTTLTDVARRLDAAGTEDPGPMAAAAELALEYLFLTRKLAKDESDDETVTYG